MPGSGNEVKGGVQATDDGSRAFLPKETVCLVTVHTGREDMTLGYL